MADVVAPSGRATDSDLLTVENLSVDLRWRNRSTTVVRDLSFSVGADEVVGLVGESGSGKTLTALSVMGLLPAAASVSEGDIRLGPRSLIGMSPRELRSLRGAEIGMVFQEPMTSLNPTFTIGHQIAEVYRRHRGCSRREARKRAIEMLDLVHIPSAATRFGDYPFQFSGGMRQRVMIAMALVCSPRLVIADEPTTALDVTVQAQILELLQRLRQDSGIGILLVTHDLGVVAESCDRVIVMYAGELVETAAATEAFARPRHPYTEGLLASLPQVEQGGDELAVIAGTPVDPWSRPTGCQFHPRCAYATESCTTADVELRPRGGSALARCIRPELTLKGVSS